jgi:hypothetical protein
MVQQLLNLFEVRTPSILEWNDFIESVAQIDSRRFVTIL